MMQVEVKGVFFHRLLGMRAGLPARVWKCIQAGKARRSTILMARRVAVSAERIVERSALSTLEFVSSSQLPQVRMIRTQAHKPKWQVLRSQ